MQDIILPSKLKLFIRTHSSSLLQTAVRVSSRCLWFWNNEISFKLWTHHLDSRDQRVEEWTEDSNTETCSCTGDDLHILSLPLEILKQNSSSPPRMSTSHSNKFNLSCVNEINGRCSWAGLRYCDLNVKIVHFSSCQLLTVK